MPDELAIAVAATLVAKGAEALAASGRSAIGALIRLVRRRLGTGTQEIVVLDGAVACPDDQQQLIALSSVLTRLMAADPIFRRQVEACWRDTTVGLSADHGGVVNHFSGSADKVIQARDIRGDVTF